MPILLKKTLLSVAAMLATALAFAQVTKVKGRVTDADSGEGIPFAGVFFEGTTIGISTDLDGYYVIETRDTSAKVLLCSILGYESDRRTVRRGSFQEMNFRLKPVIRGLDAAVVKPDNRRMKRILSQIDAHRDRNNPEKREAYKCDIYNKMEIDITNAREQLSSPAFDHYFGFVFENMDTSAVTGLPYLPVMISETKSERYHDAATSLDKEIIRANRISGIEKENFLSQFTGHLHLKTNFYQNFINAFEVEIPSPISPSGELYYNYYLIDSLHIDGRKTWAIRFHPKRFVSSPVLDGEMQIDSADYALRHINARLQKGSNVNWIRHMVIEVENTPVGDTAWFYKEDKMFIDFCISPKDSSRILSFLGNRHMVYGEPDFSASFRGSVQKDGYNVVVAEGAASKSDGWWDSERPVALTQKEQKIYTMVDSVQNVSAYSTLYSIINICVNSYYEVGKMGYGPPAELISFNDLEGCRLQFGIRSTKELNEKMRFSLYGAYGTKDKEFKGGGTLEYVFSKFPTRKLTASVRRDALQLGAGQSPAGSNSIFTSIHSSGGINKRSMVNEAGVSYHREWNSVMDNTFGLSHQRVFANGFVPMVRPDGTSLSSVASTPAHYTVRLSWDETVLRGPFIKSYIYTKYPIVQFDFIGAVSGLVNNDYSFFRSEASVDYRLPIPPVGTSKLAFNAGHIFGKVPYTMLMIHQGNPTYVHDPTAFPCMDYYEFASDTWATLHYQHDFEGFFLSKIPFMRKTRLREVATLGLAWGTLSDRNNGMAGYSSEEEPVLLFPEGMTSLEKPYVEVGVGLTNILTVLRVDAVWRLTHRYREIDGVLQKAPRLFTVTVGMEMTF